MSFWAIRSVVPKKRELHDPFFLKAKAEGYAARSAYKLLEIQERHRILRTGMRVLDLGCAPGSWMQVAAKLTARGPHGGHSQVVGVDLQPVDIELPPNAYAVVQDVFSLTPERCIELLGGPADVVLSDMAPATTGDPAGDHYKSVALCRRVLELLPSVLGFGGHMAMKVFEGSEYPLLLKDTEKLFGFCKGLKPEATRDVSREMFIIGERYKGPAAQAASFAPPPRPKHAVAPKRPTPGGGWGGAGKKP